MARRRSEKFQNNYRHQETRLPGSSYTKTVIMSSCLIVAVCISFKGYLETRVNTRFNTDKMVEKTGLDVPERYWGSYRPGLYFGMKTREPYSIVSGLMWYLPRFLKSNGDGLRHWCEQGDNLQHYTWKAHDGRNFGVQQILDGQFEIETSFVKRIGGSHGGDWTASVSVTNSDTNSITEEISLILYVALEEKVQGEIHYNDHMEIHGETQVLGGFKLSLNYEAGSVLSESYLSTVAPGLDLLKETVVHSLRVVTDKQNNGQRLILPGELLGAVDGSTSSSNFIALQLTGQAPFAVTLTYESNSFYSRPNRLIGTVYKDELDHYRKLFNNKFSETFQLQKKGWNESEIEFAKAALSNMIGGIGYFYGASRVSSAHTEGTVPYWKAPLYTAVPSRSFFPRGFLWDEAFHGLLLSAWDLDIELDIIHHWFDLMNVEGWIPREQILGIEAQSKVPDEFVTQANTNANPPVFFLTLSYILDRFGDDLRKQKKLMQVDKLYDRLEAWYDWFNVTQKGKLATAYRWQGRDSSTNRELNPRTLTSGLDDYPRASHPTDDERHVDLRCWMAIASSTLSKLASMLGRDPNKFNVAYEALTEPKALNELHWSEKKQQYSDFGLHTDGVVLKRPPSPRRNSDGNLKLQHSLPMERIVLQAPVLKFIDSHYGYVSLFPFLLKILPFDSPQLGVILKNFKDPKLMWTRFGLRSLSMTSPLYQKHNSEHDPPYWRGAIWININYLAVRALDHYSRISGPFQENAQRLYLELRSNLISNVIREYYRTGYVWEQYHDKTGEGKGCRPFTGWSALTVLIMAEIY